MPSIGSAQRTPLRLLHATGALAALLVLALAARLTFASDPRDALRPADALFTAGRYHAALEAYRALADSSPRYAPARLRLGMVYVVRGEYGPADQQLSFALGLGLAGGERDLARLYQGHAALHRGARGEASSLWAQIDERSPLYGQRRALEAEALLASGDYAAAEVAYRDALGVSPALPPAWQSALRTRLALLRASSDPAGALQELSLGRNPPAAPRERREATLAAPLLPAPAAAPEQLEASLLADPALRPQLLGQVFLDAGLYDLAEAQFASVAPDSPAATAAAAYAAYTRWRAGDRAAGLERLRALAAAHPDDARARALLAVAALGADDPDAAQSELAAVRAIAPGDPATYLAWGQWYAAQRDYVAAAREYRRALDIAPADARGIYALHLARFHLDTSLEVCEAGRPAAQTAAELLPDQPPAWVALAQARLACGDAAGARSAAARALERSPGDPEALYHMGRALAALGDREGARSALIGAADAAPASAWRARAESQLAVLGL